MPMPTTGGTFVWISTNESDKGALNGVLKGFFKFCADPKGFAT
jgi:hypothetical protein